MQARAVYPGSFDPPTLGHIDVIERAARLFDEIIVAVGVNPSKSPLLTVEERLESLQSAVASMPTVSVEAFSGLLVNFVRAKAAKSIVRGLRATADFEYEFQLAMVNRRLAPDVDTVFLMTKWEHSYLSSSMVREVAQLGGEFEPMVAEGTAPIIRRALESGRAKMTS